MKLENLVLTRPLIFFDIESTGVDIVQDKIVELCMIKYFPDHRSETLIERYNPGRPIPKEASDIHGITDADVADKPSFVSKANEVFEFIKGADLSFFKILLYQFQFPRCSRFPFFGTQRQFLYAHG
jgi:DNA polymerase-3 subunit epsilon